MYTGIHRKEGRIDQIKKQNTSNISTFKLSWYMLSFELVSSPDVIHDLLRAHSTRAWAIPSQSHATQFESVTNSKIQLNEAVNTRMVHMNHIYWIIRQTPSRSCDLWMYSITASPPIIQTPCGVGKLSSLAMWSACWRLSVWDYLISLHVSVKCKAGSHYNLNRTENRGQDLKVWFHDVLRYDLQAGVVLALAVTNVRKLPI